MLTEEPLLGNAERVGIHDYDDMETAVLPAAAPVVVAEPWSNSAKAGIASVVIVGCGSVGLLMALIKATGDVEKCPPNEADDDYKYDVACSNRVFDKNFILGGEVSAG